MTTWIRRLAYLLRQSRYDADLREEVEVHEALRRASLERGGVPASEAGHASRRAMGDVLLARQEAHDVWLGSWSTWWQDVRQGARSLLGDKTFAAMALMSLALGIGANAAIFSVVNGVVLRPLPYAEPDRLVQLFGTPAVRGEHVERLDDFRQQSTSFGALVGYGVSARYLQLGAERQRVMTVKAERPLFALLGVKPLEGRTFGPSDSANVAVVSRRFWEQQLGGASIATGQPITLDDERVTVIGVMPESFQFPYSSLSGTSGVASDRKPDLWMPVDPPSNPQQRARSAFSQVVGRLKEGVSRERAASELALIADRMQAERPDPYGRRGVRVETLNDSVLGPSVRRPLWLVFGAVGLVLLLTCVNVANLTVMRAIRRSGDTAVRAALGASPLRLVRLSLTESVLLAAAGGAAALGIAWAGNHYLGAMFAGQLPRVDEVSLDWRVALFLLAACLATSLVFGLAPALAALRIDARRVLTEVSQNATHALHGVRDALVMIQMALAFVLAIGAAVLLRELVQLRSAETGMVPTKVLTLHVGQRLSAALARGSTLAAQRFYDIADRVERLSGVRAAGFTQMLPLQNWGWSANSADFRVRGDTRLNPQPFSMSLKYVTPGYFEALGISLRAGRTFTASDGSASERVIILNEALARLQFGDRDPIGIDTNRGRIVGVIADVRDAHLGQPSSPEVYYPIAQNWSQLDDLGMTLVVRFEGQGGGLAEAVRSAVRAVDPTLAIFDVKSMETVVTESLSTFLSYLYLMTAFAVVGLVLAATGTYGLIAYVATERRRECAIRAALGADRGRVLWLVVRRGVRVVAVGLVAGVAAAVWATPLLNALPVAVDPPGLAMIGGVAACLVAVAIAACLAPAYRASRLEPMLMLRKD